MSASAPSAFAAVDLGASSGRVVVGRVGAGTLDLTEVHRFPNTPVRLPGGLHWDILALYRGVLEGLRGAAAGPDPIASIGIDTWAVDYGLLDADGRLLGNPYHYRDARTDGVAERVWERVPAAELYAVTGLQHLPFNTVYQLAAARDTAQLAAARTLLLVPDLLTHWLTGSVGAEATNASTTGLYDAVAGTWSRELLDRLELPAALLPPIRRPGDPAGTLLPQVAAETGLPESTPVTAVGSHDTASAVVAVPATDPDFAYISCGTWSLAGLELSAPVLTEESRAANFTNELGVDGTIRYLRNVMGLWLLQESLRTWAARGEQHDLPELLAAAEEAEPFRSVVDPDDPVFLKPGDMPARIADWCREHGQPVPETAPQVVRCVVESLALAHRRTIREAARLAGRKVSVVHVVGGGSRNALLCRLTADACGLPVVAGPVEATALGNVLVQARAAGVVGDLAAMRALVAATQPTTRHEPSVDPATEAAWARAEARAFG
ncbi:rhamnulokinase [Allostreptomyces psammosilenae]|uniref:Rhamnulokinase n=1 Tax=Allostreptomyces psammosilenae TaxID=1892865 RepID=A0A852ZS39_9ACTN|nr:rhamnulokinase family protein [Allostreptomyces psammosilenae]NYI03664.1 rhamnulokinase [Allostreptomyces psammosilenae]